jgi:predicted ATP-binding protein involved in virulence
MHLHPKWQRLITMGLQAAFPALQIIATSHSPQVLGELRPNQIILLGPEGTMHPERAKGLDSSEVLEELMGSAARNVGVTAALREIHHAIDDDALERAQTLLDALKLQVAEIPAVQEAQSAIDSLRWQADDAL